MGFTFTPILDGDHFFKECINFAHSEEGSLLQE